MMPTIELDGEHLTIEQVMVVGAFEIVYGGGDDDRK